MSQPTVAGGRAASVVQEVRGRKGLVLHIHDDEWPANAVKLAAALCSRGADVLDKMERSGKGNKTWCCVDG